MANLSAEPGNQSSGRSLAGGLRKFALAAGAGLAGLLFGYFPAWAARKILYPPSIEPLHASLDLTLPEGTVLPAEKVEFQSARGHRLGGWFLPGPDGYPTPWPAVLLVYGYGGYKEQMVTYAAALRQGGFATLMFDMQGAGLRRGEPITLGFQERYDLIGACRYLLSRWDVDHDRIGVLGVSMGAATALLAAAEEPAIKAVVSDSSYADLESMIQPGLRAFLGPLAPPFAPLIMWQAERIAGAKPSEIVPEIAISELGERPVFIIHGLDDPLIPVQSAERLYTAASGPREIWIVPDCVHAQAPAVAAQEYVDRVNGFFQHALGVRSNT